MKSIIPIRDWSDGFSALKHHVERSRGAIESDICAGDWERWPRSTASDALVIAAFLHPHMLEVVKGHETHGAWRRWVACVRHLVRFTLQKPHDEYPENRHFWAEVLRACVHLSTHSAPLPSQDEWEELFTDVSCSRRNGLPKDVPFGPFSGISTFKDLYVTQVQYLQRARGMDRMEPEPGMTGGTKQIPRSTNADVKKLTEFWSRQFESVQKIIGHDGMAERWNAMVREVDQLTAGASPDAVFAKNNAFWRALNALSTHVSVADQAPSKAEQLAESIKDSAANLPGTLTGAAKAVGGGISDAASAAAGGIGKVAGGLFGGFLSSAGGPLAIVGGGVLGIALLLRGRSRSAAAAEKR